MAAATRAETQQQQQQTKNQKKHKIKNIKNKQPWDQQRPHAKALALLAACTGLAAAATRLILLAACAGLEAAATRPILPEVPAIMRPLLLVLARARALTCYCVGPFFIIRTLYVFVFFFAHSTQYPRIRLFMYLNFVQLSLVVCTLLFG